MTIQDKIKEINDAINSRISHHIDIRINRLLEYHGLTIRSKKHLVLISRDDNANGNLIYTIKGKKFITPLQTILNKSIGYWVATFSS